jgi:hypothetical protein
VVDPLAGATLVSGANDGLSLIQFLWSKVQEADVIGALFDPDANRLEGDYRIDVRRIGYTGQTDDFWWYLPVKVSGFEFVPYATNPYLELQFGETQPDRYTIWRWVFPPQRGFVWNGERLVPNAATNFMVVGYSPGAIVRHFTGR